MYASSMGFSENTEKKIKLLTVADVAEILSVNPMSVYRFVNRGELPAVRIRKMIRIHPDALSEFLGGANVGA